MLVLAGINKPIGALPAIEVMVVLKVNYQGGGIIVESLLRADR